MSPQREGILDSKEWDEVKPDVRPDTKPEWKLPAAWQPSFKPVASLRKPRRILGRVASWLWPKVPPAPAKLRPTAYLDGLRGFAAFLVYWHHHELWAHDMSGQNGVFENGFGYEGDYHLVSFHGLRTFFSGGHYAVSTFFVISGYVLSAKPMSLIQAGEYGKLGDNLASALFRRWLRLFLPLILVTFAYMTSWHMFGIWVHGATQQSNWRDELWTWYTEFKNFSFIYKEGGNPWLSYSFHLWSIPVEFKGSIVIYTALIAFSRCTRNARLRAELVLIWYFMYITDGWYCAMFVAGMMLCDLDLLAKKGELPHFLARLDPAKDFIFYHLFAISMFLGGVPCESRDINQLAKNRGWYYLSYLKPQAVFDYKWFYLFWAAVFLVSAVPRIRWLKSFFETRFCQYLGRISFALYLVHGPVLWTLGDRLYFATGWETDDQFQHIPMWGGKFKLSRGGPVGLEPAFLVPHIVLLPVTFWCAEMVTRVVDEPSVKFANWLYKLTLPEQPPRPVQA